MSNLPKQLPVIRAFRESDITLRFNMYDGFITPSSITYELWCNRVKLFQVAATYDSENSRILGTIPSAELKKVKLIGNVYVRFDANNYVLGGQIKPSMTSSNTDDIDYNVSLSGDEYIVVSVTGIDLINGLDSRIETIENYPLG